MTAHALSFDLEDWHQLGHRKVTGEVIPPTSAVVEDTHRILDLLDEENVRATFFILGTVAETFPDLVREVATRGHEIGSHTTNHPLIWQLTPPAFKADIERSRGHLQDLSGQEVSGFRAPEFSVQSLTHWSFETLAEVGFRYDSSVFPLPGVRYGIPEAPLAPFLIDTVHGSVAEFPLSVWEVGGRRIPIAGGTYYRLLPGALLEHAVADLARAGRPAVLYFHPYEFHRGPLYLSSTSLSRQVRSRTVQSLAMHNIWTGVIARRLRRLVRAFSFGPLTALPEQSLLTTAAENPAGGGER